MSGGPELSRVAFYQPRPERVIASYEDQFGDTKLIHRPKGKALRIVKNCNTPALRMNRVAATLIGQKIKQLRLAKCMSLEELASLAGLASQTPKQYMWSIEQATRGEGVRTGTLYALAIALDCEVSDLLPTTGEVASAASVAFQQTVALA